MQTNNEKNNNLNEQIPLFVELAMVMDHHQLPKLMESLQAQKEQFLLFLDTEAACDIDQRRKMLESYYIVNSLYNLLSGYSKFEFKQQCAKMLSYE